MGHMCLTCHFNDFSSTFALISSWGRGMLEESGSSWRKDNYQKKKTVVFLLFQQSHDWIINHHRDPIFSSLGWQPNQENDSTPSRKRSEPTFCFQQFHDKSKISLPLKQASVSFPCHWRQFHLSPAIPIPGTYSWPGQRSSLSSPIGVGEAASLVPLLALQGQERCSWAYEQGEVRR
jgi:hypothetical protein